MSTHRFIAQGPTLQYIQSVVDPNAIASGPTNPPAYHDVTLSDDDMLPDLKAAMASLGWTYLESSPPDPGAKTLLRSNASMLPADASAILVAAGWTDVAFITLSSKGGSTFAVQVTAIGNITIGAAQARVTIDGGAFSNQVIGATAYDIEGTSQANTAFHIPVPVVPTGDYTTYTIKLQMQAVGLLASVTPRAGTVISAFEHKG